MIIEHSYIKSGLRSTAVLLHGCTLFGEMSKFDDDYICIYFPCLTYIKTNLNFGASWAILNDHSHGAEFLLLVSN